MTNITVQKKLFDQLFEETLYKLKLSKFYPVETLDAKANEKLETMHRLFVKHIVELKRELEDS